MNKFNNSFYLGFIAFSIANTKSETNYNNDITNNILYKLMVNSIGHNNAYNMTLSIILNCSFFDRINILEEMLYKYITDKLVNEYYSDTINDI